MANLPLILGLVMSLVSLVWVFKRRTAASVGALLFWLVSTLLFGPGYRAAYLQGQAAECRENLVYLNKNLTVFATKSGHYPESLREIAPIPICPTSGVDSYSGNYACSESKMAFELSCDAPHPDYVDPLEIRGEWNSPEDSEAR